MYKSRFILTLKACNEEVEGYSGGGVAVVFIVVEGDNKRISILQFLKNENERGTWQNKGSSEQSSIFRVCRPGLCLFPIGED